MAEVSAQQEMTREEVATYLREFADELHPGERQPTATGDETQDSGSDSSEQRRDERIDAAERLRDEDDSQREHDADASEAAHQNDATHENGSHEDSAREDRADSASGESTTGERVTFMVGNESATINPPGTVDFEMAVDSDSSLMGSGTRETVTFELQWDSEAVSEDDQLGVQ